MEKSRALELFNALNIKALELSKWIPTEKNKWNEWLIEQTQNDLQEIQRLHQLPFSMDNFHSAFNHLQTLIKNIHEAHQKAKQKIEPLSYETWEQQQAQQSQKNGSLTHPNLSKEKYEDYKKDLDQGKRYHSEELAVATAAMRSDTYKDLKKLLTQFHQQQDSKLVENGNAEVPKLFSDLIRDITLIKTKLDGHATVETQTLFAAKKNDPSHLKAVDNLLAQINQLKKTDPYITAKTLSLALKEVAKTRDAIYQSSQGESNPIYQALINIRCHEKYAKFKQLPATNDEKQKKRLK
jgi:hypothetical protein